MSDEVELDYGFFTEHALRRVVYDVLCITRDLGEVPGEHHFYIEFVTTASGVSIPDRLLEAYPERMTIVLQHQFKDLKVEDDGFEVTLWFKGEPSRLCIPFSAVTGFADPSAQFDLRFSKTAPEAAAASDAKVDADTSSTETTSPDNEAESSDGEVKGAEVVSLDAFRKK
ncbi:MAG: ClpXP protease specificity-enhancing factor SspB [Pseudomonadota bacterium]